MPKISDTPQGIASGLPFELSYVGFFAHAFGFETHVHQDEYELHYLPRARCTMVSGQRRVHLPDHSLTFTEPHTHHGITQSEDGGMVQWYYFRFRIRAAGARLLPALRQVFEPRGAVRLGPPFEARFREMVLQLQSENPLLKQSGAHLFCSLIYELASNEKRRASLATAGYIDELIAWMQSNLAEPLDLGEVAARIGINKSYLIRQFKLKTGASPVQFFNRLKIETASELLQNTELGLREIATQLGFCDEFYFSRLYKQFNGISPQGFRQRKG
ncbi:MAG: AraC family transcriptional regulator [Polyangiaceae bacterium]|nr:AraC family transcriptional regulator [Polyangiaceae bacterium]